MDHMNMEHMNHDHMAASPTPSGTAGASMAMTMMSTFSTSTNVTLFFSDWTTDTPAKYFGTLVFLFVVTLFNRFLGAWRSQLGHKWANDSAEARRQAELHRRFKRNGVKVETYDRGGEFDEAAPLSPPPPGMDVEHGDKHGPNTPTWMSIFGGRWRAGNPWRFNIDFPRALLEGLRALIGYLL
jgi:hypothetical protein